MVKDRLKEAFDRERDKEQKTNARNHGEREKAGPDKCPNSRTRFGLHTPDCVQSILELTEDTARAEERQGNTDYARPDTFRRLRRLLRDLPHHFESAAIKKIAHLLRDFVPGTRWIMPKDDADDCKQQENERGEGENSIICERRRQLWRLVLQPFIKRRPEQPKDNGQWRTFPRFHQVACPKKIRMICRTEMDISLISQLRLSAKAFDA